jgi:RNA polymerase sigma-70 factor (ECF subfamily)
MIDWRSMLAEHGPAVWQTVYRLLDHHADALDCYQETFLTAWQYAERRPVADWASFLSSLATRRAMDRLRRRYRDRRHTSLIDGRHEPRGKVECPLRHADARELLERVREGMAELPAKQAEVFWASCIDGLSHQQIGESMGIPSGEVRVLLHRARARLRAILDGETSSTGDDHERGPSVGR